MRKKWNLGENKDKGRENKNKEQKRDNKNKKEFTDYLALVKLEEIDKLAKSHRPISYKELCERINLKYYAGGNSKIAQLDMLQSICLYHKEGTKFIIDEYYESTAPMIINGRSKYVPYIEAVLCSILTKEQDIYMTNIDILQMCKMVNENYSRARSKNNRHKICEELSYSPMDFDIFMDNSYSNILAPIVRSALKSMERRKVLTISPAYRYIVNVEDNLYTTKECSADSDLGKMLLKIEYEVRKMLGLGEKDYIYPAILERYIAQCNSLAKEKLNIERFFPCKKISTHKDIACMEVNKLCNQLNGLMGDKILTSKYLDDLTGDFKNQMIKDVIEVNGPEPKNKYQKIIEKRRGG